MRSRATVLQQVCSGLFLLNTLAQASLAQGQTQPVSLVSISGAVTDTTGAEIPRATVTLKDGQQVIGSVLTDNYGRFQLQVRPGGYTLETSAPGFRLEKKSLQPDGTRPALEPLAISLLVASGGCGVCVSVEGLPLPILTSALSATLATIPLPALTVRKKSLPAGISGRHRS